MKQCHSDLLPEEKRGADGGGREERIPEVTMVGTELAMEFGGAAIPEACRGGSGGGGPERRHDTPEVITTVFRYFILTCAQKRVKSVTD